MHLKCILDQNHVVGGILPSLIRLGIISSYNFELRKILQRGSVSRLQTMEGGMIGGGEEEEREAKGKARGGQRRMSSPSSLHVSLVNV